jgi:PAS domain S-box-containing protein
MEDETSNRGDEKTSSDPTRQVSVSLDDVLITAELAHRPARMANYETENLALTALAEAMADSPQMILQKLVETALDLCRADSAGISILEAGGAAGVFRWHAIAGQFASHKGSHVLREASPSGIVLDRDASLLFSYPERHFDYGMAIDPPIVEALLVPFHTEGKPVGTLWLMAHTESRKFDTEDQRVLTSLSRFASIAYQVKTTSLTAVRAREDVRQILDTAAIGLTRCSRDLRYLSCNPAYEKLVGLSAEQIIGRPIIDVIGGEAFEVKRPYIERVLRGERVEYEEEVPFAAGGPRFLHVVYTPWIECEGHVAGWMASVSDITDLKRTTEALRESEERLLLAMSSGNIGFWDWDASNGRTTWSRELEDIFGLDRAGSYETFSSRVHPDDLDAVESERDAAIRNQKPFDLEFRIVLPSGELRWLSARGRGYYDETGRVMRVVGTNIDITERIQAKEALQEREQRLRLALNASRAGSWMRDARTGRVDWDERCRELYGFTPEEPASFETWLSRVHEEDRRQVSELWDQIVHRKAHDTFDCTFRIVRPNGIVSWIQSLGQVHRDADGQVMRLTGIELDVTDRQRTEEALREKEEREAFLLRLADTLRPLSDPSAMQEVTARLLGEHLHVNRVTYADIEGTDYIVRLSHANGVAPLAGRGSLALFGQWVLESDRSGEPHVVNDVRTDPRFTESERARLQVAEVAAFAGVMLVKAEQRVAAFGVSNATPRAWTKTEVDLIRDVAERMWEAVERARAEAALREREQLLLLSLDAAAAGVWTWDRFTNQPRWDDRYHAQYGLGREDPRTFDTWISHVHEEDRPRVLGHIDDVLQGHYNDWNVIFRAVRPDGTVMWMHELGRADHGPDGQVTRISGISLDITERRRAEEALQARREEERDRALHKQAEEALRRSHAELERRTLQLSRLASQLTLAEQSARKQLASTLHDGLQQLLFTAAMTLDQVVKSNSQDDQAELLQRARAEVKEAMEAARTLSVNLFPPVLHLGGLPAALTWLAKRAQEQHSIAVNLDADPQANPEASEVRVLLFEAVRELVFNAVKHAHIDRVDVKLAAGPDDTIHIQVSDVGVGFDPTIALHHTNQRGLGLFSIQERLALLGGHLHIQSAPGSGSRFTLTLPRGLPRRATDGTEAPQYDTAWQERLVYDTASGTSKLRILITDDHAIARAGLRELFGKHPQLQVVGEATNGVEAITQALVLQPDVIVMDVSMPQMNGIDATRRIHRTMPHIQIVGLSTHHDESTERLMRKAGAEAYITKNEGPGRLLDYLLSLRAKARGASPI